MNAPASRNSEHHWANQPERGNMRSMRLTAWAARRLGRRVVAPVVWLVVLYFCLSGAKARRSVAQYQAYLRAACPDANPFPTPMPIYRQYLAFAGALLDKLDAWQGKVTIHDLDVADPDGLHAQMGTGRGQILVGAHLGNMEVCRALASQNADIVLNVLVHDKNAVHFSRLLDEAGTSRLRLIQVSELDTATMLALSERIDRGEWLALAGDRIPLHGARTVDVSFLGHTAPLPQGPWLLAGLLRCPVNLLFCTRQHARFNVSMERLADSVSWTRATRTTQVQRLAQAYADRLAAHCRQAPLQWFNFFPFWSSHA
ncbi:MAG TPA: glycosyl transferase [Candidimonas sp.]|nr:glycosyl transferase [Candidimonas sp.]